MLRGLTEFVVPATLLGRSAEHAPFTHRPTLGSAGPVGFNCFSTFYFNLYPLNLLPAPPHPLPALPNTLMPLQHMNRIAGAAIPAGLHKNVFTAIHQQHSCRGLAVASMPSPIRSLRDQR